MDAVESMFAYPASLRHSKNYGFGGFDGSGQLMAVEYQHHFHGCMAGYACYHPQRMVFD